jgi:hypothetical protein
MSGREVSVSGWTLVQKSGASLYVWSTNLKNVEAMAHIGPQSHKKNDFKEATNISGYLRKPTGQLVKSDLETKWKYALVA